VRVVLQRVARASVRVDGEIVGKIGRGLLLLVGVGRGDPPAHVDRLAEKVAGLRIFEDDAGKMNHGLADVGGEVLVVSQFTLYGDVRRGRRPSFDHAAPPAEARSHYEDFVRELRAAHSPVATGEFQAMMQVELVNDGPVTVLIDSKKAF